MGCHLCELAKDQITPLLRTCDLQLVEIDIADDETLLERYGVKIPVIRLVADVGKDEDSADLGWPFDTEIVYQWLLARQ